MIKKTYLKNVLLFCGLTTVCFGSSYAEEIKKSPHEFTLGLSANTYRYDEPSYMKLSGYMAGIILNYQYTTVQNFVFGIDTDINGGNAHYSSNGTGKMKKVPQTKIEARIKGGMNFCVNRELILTPYTGFGVRVKKDRMGGRNSTTGHYGYDRSSTYLYVPMGLKACNRINADWFLEAFGEYDLFIQGKQRSHISHIGETLDHTQKKGFGLKFGLEGVRILQNKQSISFGPFVNYWNIEKSDILVDFEEGVSTVEPRNKTLEVGVALKYRF